MQLAAHALTYTGLALIGVGLVLRLHDLMKAKTQLLRAQARAALANAGLDE